MNIHIPCMYAWHAYSYRDTSIKCSKRFHLQCSRLSICLIYYTPITSIYPKSHSYHVMTSQKGLDYSNTCIQTSHKNQRHTYNITKCGHLA